jgi:hypothetical protein
LRLKQSWDWDRVEIETEFGLRQSWGWDRVEVETELRLGQSWNWDREREIAIESLTEKLMMKEREREREREREQEIIKEKWDRDISSYCWLQVIY